MGSVYIPSLRTQVVGGIQWGVTSSLALLAVFAAVELYSTLTEASAEIAVVRVFPLVLVTAFGAGVAWVRMNTSSDHQERMENLRRVEVVLLLFVLGFTLQLASIGFLLGMGTSLADVPFGSTVFPVLVFTLAITYVVEYVLDRRVFFHVN